MPRTDVSPPATPERKGRIEKKSEKCVAKQDEHRSGNGEEGCLENGSISTTDPSGAAVLPVARGDTIPSSQLPFYRRLLDNSPSMAAGLIAESWWSYLPVRPLEDEYIQQGWPDAGTVAEVDETAESVTSRHQRALGQLRDEEVKRVQQAMDRIQQLVDLQPRRSEPGPEREVGKVREDQPTPMTPILAKSADSDESREDDRSDSENLSHHPQRWLSARSDLPGDVYERITESKTTTPIPAPADEKTTKVDGLGGDDTIVMEPILPGRMEWQKMYVTDRPPSKIFGRMPSYLWQQRRTHHCAGAVPVTEKAWREGWMAAVASYIWVLEKMDELEQGGEGEGSTGLAAAIMECLILQEDRFGGVLLCHIDALIRVSKGLLTLIEEHDAYREPLLTLLSMLQKPMLALNTSEVSRHSTSMLSLINILANFVGCRFDDVSCAATTLLCKWLTAGAWPSRHDAVRDLYLYQPVLYELHSAVVETSYASLLAAEAWDPTSMTKRDSFLREFVLLLVDRDMCRQQIAASDVVTKMLSSLAVHDPASRQYQVLLSILSAMLMYEDDSIKVAPVLASRECLTVLREQLRRLIVPKADKFSLNIRNDLVHIALMLAAQVPNGEFVTSGILEDICVLVSYPEVRRKHPLVDDIEFREYHDDDDFLHADVSLKSTLLVLLSAVATSAAVVTVLKKQGVMAAILTYVAERADPESPFSAVSFVQLRQHAMTALLHIAPKMVEDMLSMHGTTRLLLLIEFLCTEQCLSDEVVNGNVVRAALTNAQQTSLLQTSFQILYAVVRNDDAAEQVKADLHSQGVIQQVKAFVLEVLEKRFARRMEREGFNEKPVSDSLHTAVRTALQLLNWLHTDAYPQYDPADEDSFQFLCTLLELMAGKAEGIWADAVRSNDSIPLTILDSIRFSIINNAACEEKVFQLGLIYKLLDLLNVSRNDRLQSTLVGILSDLADNGGNITHFQTWSVLGTKKRGNIFSLMGRLWRQSECDAGVIRDSMGKIVDQNAPLLTRKQIMNRRNSEKTRMPATNSSVKEAVRVFPTMVEVTESMRAAIANIVLRIGSIPVHMSAEDRIVRTAVQLYLDMKCLEMVQETIDYLDHYCDVVPAAWVKWLAESLTYSGERVRSAMDLQRHYASAARKEKRTEETQYFEKKLTWNHMDELTKAQEKRRQLLTSKIEALEAESERRRKRLESARRVNRRPEEGVFHDMTLETLRTAFSGEEVSIDCMPTLLASVRASKNTEVRRRLAKTLTHFKEDEHEPLPGTPIL